MPRVKLSDIDIASRMPKRAKYNKPYEAYSPQALKELRETINLHENRGLRNPTVIDRLIELPNTGLRATNRTAYKAVDKLESLGIIPSRQAEKIRAGIARTDGQDVDALNRSRNLRNVKRSYPLRLVNDTPESPMLRSVQNENDNRMSLQIDELNRAHSTSKKKPSMSTIKNDERYKRVNAKNAQRIERAMRAQDKSYDAYARMYRTGRNALGTLGAGIVAGSVGSMAMRNLESRRKRSEDR